MPINPDEEASRVQYKTPLTCPDCKEHIFETSAILESELDFVEAQCTNCGYALNKDDILTQMKNVPPSAMQKVIVQSIY